MIKKLLVIGILLINFTLKGQNLVPNGGFEQYTGCPPGVSHFDSVLFWINPTNATPDYFNQCSTGGAGVPMNGVGFQFANNGVAYAGLLTYWDLNLSWREYIEVPLVSTLISNMCYHFEMYVSCSDFASHASDELSVYFSDTLIDNISNSSALPYFPDLNNNLGFITDTINWILYSGNYMASGGENYLIIGNFKSTLYMDTLFVNNNASFLMSYVYIDDVSLTSCTGINENNPQTEITIYPNPAGEELTINLQGLKNLAGLNNEIKIYDMMGKEVLKSYISNPKSQINISTLKQGMYFIEINGLRKKFVKQ